MRIGNDARIDGINNLHVARQQAFDQMHRPAFKGLRQQRVVGVSRGGARNFPGFVPGKMMLINQQAHELGNGDCRMRVIQLNGGLFGKVQHAAILADMAPEKILQRCRGEEIFLAQAQFLASRGGVRRIQEPA